MGTPLRNHYPTKDKRWIMPLGMIMRRPTGPEFCKVYQAAQSLENDPKYSTADGHDKLTAVEAGLRFIEDFFFVTKRTHESGCRFYQTQVGIWSANLHTAGGPRVTNRPIRQ